MNLIKFLKERALALAGGAVRGGSPAEADRNLLISSPQDVRDFMLRQYDVWYTGDSNELLNFYTRANGVQTNYEPWYWKNVRSYFWSRSSSESDMKRTHSHIPQSIVDTFGYIMGRPTVSGSDAGALDTVLDECDFWTLYETQKAKTLYQGWGAYKISWDLDVSPQPFVSYYGAKDVDFVYKGGRLTSVIFKDWYALSETQRMLIVETRARHKGSVLISTEAFLQMPVAENDAQLQKIAPENWGEYPQLSGTDPLLEIRGSSDLLAYPCVFFSDDSDNGLNMPGRSIFAGRIDIFDDLDQELSQKANSVTKSTAVEYFNTDFLERNPETGLPVMPHLFDRKYTSFHGGKSADGTSLSSEPVQVTQPQINFREYSESAIETLKFALHGLLSPATMGIDVSVQSTQQSQREKEKITIATRNHLIDRETRLLRQVFRGLLNASDYLNDENMEYHDSVRDISVKYPEFADNSFEEKLQTLGDALDNGNLSPDMYLDKLYGDALSEDERSRELEFLRQSHDPSVQAEMQKQMMMMGGDGDEPAAGAMDPESDAGGM